MVKREDVYTAAFAEKKAALEKKKAVYDLMLKTAYDQTPRLCEIDSTLASLGAKIAITAMAGDTAGLELLQKTMTCLSDEKSKLLKQAQIEPLKYDCVICGDTGRTRNGKICECIKALAKKIATEKLSSEMPLDECKFENFNLNLYTDENDARKKMTAILKLCREYAIGFSPKSSPNLLFIGDTGLGKTHLTLSIVSSVLEKGYDVIYGSAFNLLKTVEKEHFGSGGDSYESMLNCDLLVIDDLGTEFTSPFTQTTLYGLINTRILSKKPTIINTNLSMGEIAKRYTDRIASRLIGCYTARKFVGKDIRQIKAMQSH